jgi:dephospho-CoA kinase
VLKIGLTGGIGCGKSTVTALFAQWQVPIIDADCIAHDLVAVGQPALAQLSMLFGEAIIQTDGSLHRARLRELVFSDAQKKQQLEALLHPLIFQAIKAQLSQLTAPYCIIAIPLLFETKMTALVDRVLVVDCPLEMQIERVQKRDALPIEKIHAIIASQASREFRLAHADDCLDNASTDNALAQQVKKLHNFYSSLSNGYCQ